MILKKPVYSLQLYRDCAFLPNSRYSYIVPVGDAYALAQAMQAALVESPDREALKVRARDFAVDKIADEYLDVLLPGWRGANHRS